jgi:glycosyltransferase involved in cell wall biosynthesis
MSRPRREGHGLTPRAKTLAVDARALWGSGIGRYTREIVSGLARLGGFGTIRLIGAPKELEPFIASIPPAAARSSLEVVPLRGGRYSPVAQAGWAAIMARGEVGDVTLFPHWDVPLMKLPRRSVVTIHDLIHLRVKGAASPARRAVARAMIGRVVQSAARMIVDSACTQLDLVSEFPSAGGRVDAVPLGVSEIFSMPSPLLSAVRDDIRQPYILCVANRKPHKNLLAAVEVLSNLAPTHRTLRMVFAGERFAAWKQTMTRARELNVEDRIVDLDAISDETLHALYANAAVYLHPSRYEGFGFPILEAMASGAPVVASNATSIPEVAGRAAALVDPDDIEAMTAAVARLLDSRAERERASAAGRRQAALFSWSRTAAATQRILLDAAAA